MEKNKILKYIPRVMLILLFISMSFYFYAYSSPEELISFIGVKNAYALIFILAFLGGMTTFSGIPYHLVLITLATGGLNPLLLGLSTAAGVMLGDSTSYYVGYQGSVIIPGALQKILMMIRNFGLNHPKILPLFFFLYGSLSPFSNDFIVVSMGLSRYPYWRVMVPLGLGNLVFNISLAYLATQAYNLLKGIVF
jgi:membrane protein YqaA with SNARE-associated domain